MPCARELRYALCRKFSYVRKNCPLTRSVWLSPACLLLVSLRSGRVTAVRFVGPNTVASSSEDGSTKLWDLETGQEKAEAVPEGFKFPKQGGAQKQRIGDYVVAAKGRTLVILEAPHDKAETAADGKAETAPKVETIKTAEAEQLTYVGRGGGGGCIDCQQGMTDGW